jgi:hypothetical protein
MIRGANTFSIEMKRASGPQIENQVPRTEPFKLGTSQQEMVFDGRLEDAVVASSIDRRSLVTDLSTAQKLFSSENAKGAFAQLDSGAESVKVDLEGRQWNAVKRPDQGIYEFTNTNLDVSSNRIQTDGKRIAVHFEGEIGGMAPLTANQRLFGSVNANGTLTVLAEDLTLTERSPVVSLWS